MSHDQPMKNLLALSSHAKIFMTIFIRFCQAIVKRKLFLYLPLSIYLSMGCPTPSNYFQIPNTYPSYTVFVDRSTGYFYSFPE